MRLRQFTLALAAAAAAGLLSPYPARAQDADELRSQVEQILGRPLSDDDIVRLLQQSGLSPDQVRAQLASRGLDPSTAEGYLAVLEGRVETVPGGTDPTAILEVLAGVPALRQGAYLTATLGGDSLAPPVIPPLDSALVTGPPIFGKQLFERATSQFQPVLTGPVPRDYLLGPDDEIVLVLSGDVELAYRLPVNREGWFVIPDVGRVSVNGLTLAQLEDVLYTRLSAVYSGISRGPEATTFFDVSLGALRLNRVYVVGEAERPGAYDISSLSTALGALYYAGGPNEVGSFRNIRVNRGNRTVREIDIYDYLLEGKTGSDASLDQGDVVFVPLAEVRVEVDGAIRRPGIYEVKDDEGLRDLIHFAGDIQPFADVRSIQIDRVVPFGERGDGPGRQLIDVDLADVLADDAESIALRDGDRITVFAVSDLTRNEVVVTGAVWRPGVYAVDPDTRLWDVIGRAGGLLPDVFPDRAQIQRLDDRNYTRSMVGVNLATAGGQPIENPLLEPHDQIYIYAIRSLRERATISVGGWVRNPGTYPYVAGMTAEDAILKAGGVRPGASLREAEVARMQVSETRSDTLTRTIAITLDSTFVAFATARTDGSGQVAAPPPSGADGGFALEPHDAVFVRGIPGFETPKTVVISGEVMYPGPYTIQVRGETLSSVIQRAGGLTAQAYGGGLQLWRAITTEVVDTVSVAELIETGVLDTTFVLPAQDTTPVAVVQGGRDENAVSALGIINPFPTSEPPTPAAPATPQPELESNLIQLPSGDTLATYLLQRRTERRYTRMGIKLDEAVGQPGGAADIPLQDADSIYVPPYVATVSVQGQVGSPGLVPYVGGKGLGFYIEQAGGFAQDADKSRTRVRYANGDVAVRGSKFLFFGGYVPNPDPGAEITVPLNIPKPITLSGRDIAAIVASLATVLIVATR